MDDEFKLCWKNFQDNIASGFQNLYDRGDLVDVTLACDGKLLHAHKIVLAICSPYFQEIFITNPCKHPIIILKDVTFNIMCELLEFMYQGVVNVKHTELQSFMKIGQLLQIKGLATNTSASSSASNASEKSTSQVTQGQDEATNCVSHEQTTSVATSAHNNSNLHNNNGGNLKTTNDGNGGADPSNVGNAGVGIKAVTRVHSTPPMSPTPLGLTSTVNHQQLSFKASPESASSLHPHSYHNSPGGMKRGHVDFNADALSAYSRKQFRRSTTDPSNDHNESAEVGGSGGGGSGMDPVTNPVEDFFLSSIPHISMMESRYDLNNLKRDVDGHHGPGSSSTPLRNSFGPAFGLDYNFYKNNSGPNSATEYPNELHMPNDYSKNFGNHMDIPPIAPGEHWFQGKLEFMLSQRGKPLLVHDGHTFGIQYVRKDKKYWQCNLSRKFNCKARVTTTDTGEIIVTNNEHCHTEIRQHLRKDYQRNKVMMNALMNFSTNQIAQNLRRQTTNSIGGFQSMLSAAHSSSSIASSLAAHLDSSGSEQSVLNLGKDAVKRDATSPTAAPSLPVQDEDTPLDCGIRSTALAEEAMAAARDNGAKDTSQSDDNWKCKSEVEATTH